MVKIKFEDYVDARVFSKYMGREVFGSCSVFDTPLGYTVFRGELESRDGQVPDIIVICIKGRWNRLGTRYEGRLFEIVTDERIKKEAIERAKQALEGR